MPRKKHSAEEIIRKLREAEVLLAQGKQLPEVCRILCVSQQTYFRWRKEYGGLKKVVADLTLDKLILKEAASGNF